MQFVGERYLGKINKSGLQQRARIFLITRKVKNIKRRKMINYKYNLSLGERINEGQFECLFTDDARPLITDFERGVITQLVEIHKTNSLETVAKSWGAELAVGIQEALKCSSQQTEYSKDNGQNNLINKAYFMLEDKFHQSAFSNFCDILKIDSTTITDEPCVIKQADYYELTAMGFYYDYQESPYAVSFIVSEKE